MHFFQQSKLSLGCLELGSIQSIFHFLSLSILRGGGKKGYFHVHFSYVDIIVHPHFNYDIRVEYFGSLINTCCRIWNQVVIAQIHGILTKASDESKGGDGHIFVCPNFTISWEDKYVQSAFCLLLQVKGIGLQPEFVYATIGGQCIYRLLNIIFPPNFPAEVSYT